MSTSTKFWLALEPYIASPAFASATVLERPTAKNASMSVFGCSWPVHRIETAVPFAVSMLTTGP